MFDCRVVRVLISSPGDCRVERNEMVKELHYWNMSYAESTGIYLAPWRWEENSYATYGHASGQETLNEQLVSKADICVAFFRHRLGTPTADYDSGTVEEIERCAERGLKPAVHFLDDGTRPPHEEESRLLEYQESLQGKGFYYLTYQSHMDGVRMAMVAVKARVDELLKQKTPVNQPEQVPAPQPTSDANPNRGRNSLDATPSRSIEDPYARQIILESRRRNRHLTELMSGMQGLVQQDWTVEIGGFESGWELENASGLPLELRSYRVVADYPGSRIEDVWAEGTPQQVIAPSEHFTIEDYGGREAYELRGARIQVEYVADGVFLQGELPVEPTDDDFSEDDNDDYDDAVNA